MVQQQILVPGEVDLIAYPGALEEDQLRLIGPVVGVLEAMSAGEVAISGLVVLFFQGVQALVVVALVDAQGAVLVPLGAGAEVLLSRLVVVTAEGRVAQGVMALVQPGRDLGGDDLALFQVGQGFFEVPVLHVFHGGLVIDLLQQLLGVAELVVVGQEGGRHVFQTHPVGQTGKVVVEAVRPAEHDCPDEHHKHQNHLQDGEGLLQVGPPGQHGLTGSRLLVRVPVAGNALKGPGGLEPLVVGAGALLALHGVGIGGVIAFPLHLLRQLRAVLRQLRSVGVVPGSGEHLRRFAVVLRLLLEGNGTFRAGNVALTALVELLGGLGRLKALLGRLFLLAGLFGVDDFLQRLNAQIAVGDFLGGLHILLGLFLGRLGLQGIVLRLRHLGLCRGLGRLRSSLCALLLRSRGRSRALLFRRSRCALLLRWGFCIDLLWNRDGRGLLGLLCLVHALLHSAVLIRPSGPVSPLRDGNRRGAIPRKNGEKIDCNDSRTDLLCQTRV